MLKLQESSVTVQNSASLCPKAQRAEASSVLCGFQAQHSPLGAVSSDLFPCPWMGMAPGLQGHAEEVVVNGAPGRRSATRR